MHKKFCLSIVLIAIVGFAFAGKSTNTMEIKITVKGLENEKLILANYYGDKEYVKDTLTFNAKGVVLYKDTPLPGGVYLAVFPKLGNHYFEFIVGEPQVNLETDTTDLTGHMKVNNSPENELFYQDMHFLANMKEASDSISKLYKADTSAKQKEKYRDQLNDMDKQVKARRNDVITKHPDFFYAKLLLCMKDVEIPDAPKDANGKIIDSSFQWRYYKNHYWDYVDLKDDRLLRCPVFHNKLKTFMNQVIAQTPDSINADGDELLAKTDWKNEIYRYIVTYIFNEAANSKVMCFDAIYVHYGEKYFCDPQYTPWIDSVKRFKICDRVKRLKPVLCDKKAQSLILPTDSTEMEWKSLYDIHSKYTILAFWDPDCGHCKKEIPLLSEAYHDLLKKGIDVKAFCPAIMEIEAYKDWVEFIKKNNLDWINVCDPKRHSNFRYEWDVQSTPQIYILDSNKEIKARRIGADQVEDYILHLENPSYKGKLYKVNDEDKQEGAEEKKDK